MATLQLYRGPSSSIPTLADGEPGFTTDTQALYIGYGGTNYLIGGGSGLSVTMSGDVTGSSSSNTVSKINGVSLGSTTATAGNLLVGSGSSWVSKALSGDGSLASSGALTVTGLRGNPVSSSSPASNQVLQWNGSSWAPATASAGTLTNLAVGGLSPLFTTSVSAPTTTPTVSFTLSNVSANLFFGGPTSGGAAAPSFRALGSSDVSGSGALVWLPFSVSYTALQTGATTNTVLLDNVAAGTIIHACLVNVTTAFKGSPNPSTVGMSIGYTANNSAFISSLSLTATGNNTPTSFLFNMTAFASGITLNMYINASSNLSGLTQGAMEIYLLVSVP